MKRSKKRNLVTLWKITVRTEPQNEMKHEAKEEKKDIATEVEENDIRTAARGMLVVGGVGQHRDPHRVTRGDFPSIDGLVRRRTDNSGVRVGRENARKQRKSWIEIRGWWRCFE